MPYPEPIKKLLELFGKLPGVGPKTAERFVFWLLKQPTTYIHELGAAVTGATNANKLCAVCYNFSNFSPCSICKDTRRDPATVCVVEDYSDLYAIEHVHEYQGLYHVLGGLIKPLDEITPEKLTIAALLDRIKLNAAKEVILALNPTIEGETTMLYLTRLLRDASPATKITHLGRGLPYGADLEYADTLTLSHALQGRKTINN